MDVCVCLFFIPSPPPSDPFLDLCWPLSPPGKLLPLWKLPAANLTWSRHTCTYSFSPQRCFLRCRDHLCSLAPSTSPGQHHPQMSQAIFKTCLWTRSERSNEQEKLVLSLRGGRVSHSWTAIQLPLENLFKTTGKQARRTLLLNCGHFQKVEGCEGQGAHYAWCPHGYEISKRFY